MFSGLGSTPSTSGGLFGQNKQSTGADLFATPVSNTAFGAKTPGFSEITLCLPFSHGFTAKTTGSAAGFAIPGFGSNTPAPTGGLFGQNTSLSTTTGLFGGGQQTNTFGGNQNSSF
ncbi:hypothetical protein ACJMK2_032797, partial [Sinanodonta woodiana]